MSAQQHGTAIQWSTINSPKLCGGIAEAWTYRDNINQGEVTDEQLNIAAMALTGRTGEFSFETTITDDTADLPDLSEGAKIAVTGIASGTCLLSEVVERWAIGQAKTGSMRGTHFPAVTGGAGADAGTYGALTPDQTTGGIPIIRPGGKVVWGTKGLSSSLGIVQSLVITQSLRLNTETDEAGDIVFVAVTSYMRRIQLEVLALAAQGRPAINATLVVTGGPAHSTGGFNVNVEERFAKGRGKIYSIDGMWFPGLAG